jgi:hypothetical protein
MDNLEQDAREVLRLVRSVKNTFGPINRIPQEILSLIPGYRGTEKALIALTHVCRGWREQLISCSSLWASLDCANVDRTRVYLERSRTSPLDICLGGVGRAPFLQDALLLTVPHGDRLKCLSITAFSEDIVELTKHFLHCHAPLLEKLRIHSYSMDSPTIQAAIFDGDLSSLRELRLSVTLMDLPRKSLSNLTTFDFRNVPFRKQSVIRLLDFFEQAPILRRLILYHAFPKTSDAPQGRMVSLPHLKLLHITACPAFSILLNHLSIPPGASLVLESDGDGKSPISTYLPSTSSNLGNVSHITSINLRCEPNISLRLEGSTGGLHICDLHRVDDATSPSVVGSRVLHSLDYFDISATRRLTVTQCGISPPPEIEKSLVFQTLLRMNALHTLTLTDCLNLDFVFALNPGRTPSKAVVCTELEEFVLYIESGDRFCIDELLEMAKERASRGAKLSAITIVCPQEFVPAKEVDKLKDCVSSVGYRLGGTVPEWDYVSNSIGVTSHEPNADWY